MAASPKVANLLFRTQSGKSLSYSLYLSDVANAFCGWATTATATSSSVNFITAPENMQLVDISISAAPTDTTSLVFWLDDSPLANSIIQDANTVASVQSRVFPPVGIAKGRKVQLVQLA